MPWEWRKNRQYYTRTRKVNGEQIREYCGGGLAGQLAAMEDEERRAARAAVRRRDLAEQDELSRQDELIEAVGESTQLLTHLSLLAAGFHRHDRGAWRKRRHAENERAGHRAG
jgi:hypothetical protein